MEATPPRTRVAILGSGNIGTDVLVKPRRSDVLDPVATSGVDPPSDGPARARAMGLWTMHEGLDAFLADPVLADVPLVYDATAAYAHRENARALRGCASTG